MQFPPSNEKIGREGREIGLKTKVADYAEQVNISAVFSNVTLNVLKTSPMHQEKRESLAATLLLSSSFYKIHLKNPCSKPKLEFVNRTKQP